MIVVPGSSNPLLSLRLARALEAELAPVEIRKFPDGEKYLRITRPLEGETAILLQSLAHKPDEYLVELCLLAEAARGAGASKVVAAIPYLAYARQDARFNPGEPISLKVVAGLLNSLELDAIVTVDAHLHRLRDLAPFLQVEFIHLSASKSLAEYFIKEYKFSPNELAIVGPDVESEALVAKAASHVKAEHTVFVKKRLSPTEVVVTPREEEVVKEKMVLVMDDIISTGGTMADAAKQCLKLGAKAVYACCTHPILVNGALTKIYLAGVKSVFASDSVPSPVSCVSIAPLLAECLRGWTR